MATITKQGKSWKAIVRRAGFPVQTKCFTLKSAAEQWARQTELEMVDGKYIAVSKDTVESVFKKFRDEECQHRKGCKWEKTRINAYIRDVDWMKLPLNKMTDDALTNWMNDRLKVVKGATVNRDLNLISAVFTHARKVWKMKVGVNPVTNVKRPPKGKGRKRRVSPDEYSKIVDYFNAYEVGAVSWYAGQMFVFAIETGMRLGELVNLMWSEVHQKQKYLEVSDSKNNDGREVPLSAAAIKLLKTLPTDDEFVFPVVSDSLGGMFRRGCGALGIKGLTFHDTRHEATSRLAKKLDIMALAKMIGHRDLRSLMIYYNPTPEELAENL